MRTTIGNDEFYFDNTAGLRVVSGGNRTRKSFRNPAKSIHANTKWKEMPHPSSTVLSWTSWSEAFSPTTTSTQTDNAASSRSSATCVKCRLYQPIQCGTRGITGFTVAQEYYVESLLAIANGTLRGIRHSENCYIVAS